MASGSDELSVLEGDDVTISPQDVTRRVNSGEYSYSKEEGLLYSMAHAEHSGSLIICINPNTAF